MSWTSALKHPAENVARQQRWPCRPPGAPGSVTIVEPDPGDSAGADMGRPSAVRVETKALVRRSREARARALAIGAEILQGRRVLPRTVDDGDTTECGRSKAGLDLTGCHRPMRAERNQHRDGDRREEAFDLLRQASQRANVKLRVLATHLVEHVASSGIDNVTPIALGANGT